MEYTYFTYFFHFLLETILVDILSPTGKQPHSSYLFLISISQTAIQTMQSHWKTTTQQLFVTD